jgi:hypothetical protein
MTRTAIAVCLSLLCASSLVTAQAADRERFAESVPPANAAAAGPASLLAPPRASDPVWEGLLIGGAAGIVGGFVVAPPLFCGSNDSECSAIVKVAIGVPVAVGGFVAGALIDKFHQRGHLVWRSRSGLRVTQIDPLVAPGGAGIQVTARFK